MTINELIEKLKTYPPETEVEVLKNENGEAWSYEPELDYYSYQNKLYIS
jgi:hypothetical protein